MKTEEIEEVKKCDPALRPPSSPIPAGYSNASYTVCNETTGLWEWYDPQISE